MAFLDNSGDIILDAVLTDTGRFRLAKGDGSFKIVKFALSDDEINYRLYNKNHVSGSAYYDLEILQTPVMEAFTNNTSTMNYKLLSIPRTNLLYLPIMKINSIVGDDHSGVNAKNKGYVIAADTRTWGGQGTGYAASLQKSYQTDAENGMWNGEDPDTNGGGPGTAKMIRLDQEIDNVAISWRNSIDRDLMESQYIIEIDSRLGSIASPDRGGADPNISFIDDDNIASYYINDTPFVTEIHGNAARGWPAETRGEKPDVLTIKGPQGTSLRFRIKSSLELITSTYMFNTIGSVFSSPEDWGFTAGTNYRYIDTMVKVTGATTGYKINLPVRFVKKL